MYTCCSMLFHAWPSTNILWQFASCSLPLYSELHFEVGLCWNLLRGGGGGTSSSHMLTYRTIPCVSGCFELCYLATGSPLVASATSYDPAATILVARGGGGGGGGGLTSLSCRNATKVCVLLVKLTYLQLHKIILFLHPRGPLSRRACSSLITFVFFGGVWIVT